jgi:hypothetical protein
VTPSSFQLHSFLSSAAPFPQTPNISVISSSQNLSFLSLPSSMTVRTPVSLLSSPRRLSFSLSSSPLCLSVSQPFTPRRLSIQIYQLQILAVILTQHKSSRLALCFSLSLSLLSSSESRARLA